MKIIMFTGVKGVGKSTLVIEVAKVLKLPCADYADFILEFMNTHDKDMIESLSINERIEIVKKIRDSMEQKFIINKDKGFFLLENHLTTIYKGQIVIPPLDIYWRFNLAGIIVVYSDPRKILERRESDPIRNRSKEKESIVISQQRENSVQAMLINKTYKIPLKYLCNNNYSISLKEAINWVKLQIKSRANI